MTIDQIICDYPTSEAENLAQIRAFPPKKVFIPANAPRNAAINSNQQQIDADQDKSEENFFNNRKPVTKQLYGVLSDKYQENDPLYRPNHD